MKTFLSGFRKFEVEPDLSFIAKSEIFQEKNKCHCNLLSAQPTVDTKHKKLNFGKYRTHLWAWAVLSNSIVHSTLLVKILYYLPSNR